MLEFSQFLRPARPVRTLIESNTEPLNTEELSAQILEHGDRLSHVLAWFEDHGLRWGLRDQHHVARLCLAASGVEAPEGGVWPDASIDAKSLAQVLALPKLPEDHSELQALLGHLRKMSHLLGSERQGEIGHTKQEVRAQGDDLEVLRGRVEVLESSIPCFGRWFGTALFRRFGTCSLITKHPFWCVLLILRGYIYIYMHFWGYRFLRLTPCPPPSGVRGRFQWTYGRS